MPTSCNDDCASPNANWDSVPSIAHRNGVNDQGVADGNLVVDIRGDACPAGGIQADACPADANRDGGQPEEVVAPVDYLRQAERVDCPRLVAELGDPRCPDATDLADCLEQVGW